MATEPEEADLLVAFEIQNITGDYREYYKIKRNNFLSSIQQFPEHWEFFCKLDETWKREISDLEVAESLTANHEQLAAAAFRYPNGIETIYQESEERRKQFLASGATCGGGFIMAGDPRDFAYQMALRQSSQGGDFGPSIEHALERYREDNARGCW